MGQIARVPQTGEASKAPIIRREDGVVNWSKPAEVIFNQLRGFTPWPGAHVGGLKIIKAKVSFDSEAQEPGTVIRLVRDEGPVVKCGLNSLVLLQVQPEGKKAMPAWSWWQGARLKIGDKIV